MMDFDHEDIVLANGSTKYTLEIVFNGEFYQTRIIHPPTPMWNCYGYGCTRQEAITNIIVKLEEALAA